MSGADARKRWRERARRLESAVRAMLAHAVDVNRIGGAMECAVRVEHVTRLRHLIAMADADTGAAPRRARGVTRAQALEEARRILGSRIARVRTQCELSVVTGQFRTIRYVGCMVWDANRGRELWHTAGRGWTWEEALADARTDPAAIDNRDVAAGGA